MKLGILFVVCLVVVGCAAVVPMRHATPIRGPVAAALTRPLAPAEPTQLPVGFSNLPPGTYQVHLHTRCSGSQSYHLAYLRDLTVGPTHTGQVLVPRADIGRGWCVIVYADPVRSIVLATQPI